VFDCSRPERLAKHHEQVLQCAVSGRQINCGTTKWLELLKEINPKLSRVALLWDSATGSTQLKAIDGKGPRRNRGWVGVGQKLGRCE